MGYNCLQASFKIRSWLSQYSFAQKKKLSLTQGDPTLPFWLMPYLSLVSKQVILFTKTAENLESKGILNHLWWDECQTSRVGTLPLHWQAVCGPISHQNMQLQLQNWTQQMPASHRLGLHSITISATSALLYSFKDCWVQATLNNHL